MRIRPFAVALVPFCLAFTATIASLVSCSSETSSSSPSANAASSTPTPATTTFSSSITSVAVQIDYQPNAAPFTGPITLFGDTFSIFQTNAARVFAKSKVAKTVTIPSTLSAMNELSDVTGSTFTTDQILAIATAHRAAVATGTSGFYIVFLDGYLAGADGGPNDQVLGVSIGATGVMALFKPVINSTSSRTDSNIDKFVEQATLVHEFGHAVGLVNNGLPLTSAHQDTAHGAHCTNTECTMYWANEGPESAANFVKTYLLTASTVLYGSECLADIDAVATSAP